MKHWIFLLMMSLFVHPLRAQTTFCDTVFHMVPGSAQFMGSSFSGGDSVLQVSLVNISAAQSMAYPTAKLIPLNPLPAGMSLSPNSSGFNTVFASSYVPGDTSMLSFYYVVSQPIPLNYMVWFELWVDGDNQGTDIDSCMVRDSFQVNLNPAPMSSENDLTVFNSDYFVSSGADGLLFESIGYSGEIQVLDLAGRMHYRGNILQGESLILPLASSGLYILQAGRRMKILHTGQ
jgi:hypothetical protein